MPEMKSVLDNVGVSLTQDATQVRFGASIREGKVYSNTSMGSSAYEAGIENGDKIIQVGDYVLSDTQDFNTIKAKFKPNDTVKIIYERLGNTKETTLTFKADPSYSIVVNENATDEQKAARNTWLNSKE